MHDLVKNPLWRAKVKGHVTKAVCSGAGGSKKLACGRLVDTCIGRTRDLHRLVERRLPVTSGINRITKCITIRGERWVSTEYF